MKWIKASERVPDWFDEKTIHCRHIVTGEAMQLVHWGEGEELLFSPVFEYKIETKIGPEFIEWLDESEGEIILVKNIPEYIDFLKSLNVGVTVDPGYIPRPSPFDSIHDLVMASQTNVEVEINGLTEAQLLDLVRNTDAMIKQGNIIKLDMILKHDRVNRF